MCFIILDSDARLLQMAMVVVHYQRKTVKCLQTFWRKKRSWTNWKKR